MYVMVTEMTGRNTSPGYFPNINETTSVTTFLGSFSSLNNSSMTSGNIKVTNESNGTVEFNMSFTLVKAFKRVDSA